jgi:alpha-L-rhamnosidase
LTSVTGGIPTAQGIISAAFNSRSGISQVTVPPGTTARFLSLPLGKNVPASLKINGKLEWKAGSNANKAISVYSTPTEDFLVIKDVTPGEYTFSVDYKSRVNQIPIKDNPWKYKIDGISQDSISGGKWKGTYGGDGSVLFNYYKPGRHIERLPAYLSTLKLSRYADIHRKVQEDSAILQDSSRNTNFGAITTRDYNICEQSMTIGLPVSDNTRHRITLYFLDQDDQGRRSAIEIFDMNTLNLIGPMIYVKNYQKGKYVSFNFSGPIRIRINQVRGINVSLSGVFLDKVN